jgi:hypothetical protein
VPTACFDEGACHMSAKIDMPSQSGFSIAACSGKFSKNVHRVCRTSVQESVESHDHERDKIARVAGYSSESEYAS